MTADKMKIKTSETLTGLDRGDLQSFDLLYRKYYPSVERFVLKSNGTIEDAKDIYQDTMIIMLEKLHADQFVLTASLKTYIFAISKNLWLKKLRGDSYLRSIENSAFYTEITAIVEDEISYTERLQMLLKRISAHCARLLHAMFFMNKGIDEVQKEFGYSSKHNAQNQKYKCLEQIKRKSKSQGSKKI